MCVFAKEANWNLAGATAVRFAPAGTYSAIQSSYCQAQQAQRTRLMRHEAAAKLWRCHAGKRRTVGLRSAGPSTYWVSRQRGGGNAILAHAYKGATVTTLVINPITCVCVLQPSPKCAHPQQLYPQTSTLIK